MFGNRRMPNGMSEEAQSRGHAVWEGAPCKGALYPIMAEERSVWRKAYQYKESFFGMITFDIPLHVRKKLLDI